MMRKPTIWSGWKVCQPIAREIAQTITDRPELITSLTIGCLIWVLIAKEEPVNRRKFASDIDPGNKSEAECKGGEQKGEEEDRIVSKLDKTVQGVVQLASGLLHVELDRDEVEDN